MEERRKFLRQKSFVRGCIYFNNGDSQAECIVRDITSHGARLILPDGLLIPDMIDLYMPQTEKYARAQVLWRRDNELGLVFATPLETEAPLRVNGPITERIHLIEREIDGLKRMLRHLKAHTAVEDSEAA